MTHHLWRSAALFSLVAVTAAATPALAEDRPFKIKGGGEAAEGLPLPGQDPRPLSAVGEATFLGRYHGEGTIVTFSAVPDVAHGVIHGTFGSGSPFYFTAANGDVLATQFGRTDFGAEEPGHFTLTIQEVLPGGALVVTGHFVAEFVVEPQISTGRFAGVTGRWWMTADSEPFVLGSDATTAYHWEGAGELTFPRDD
jgi:hypothetical protein